MSVFWILIILGSLVVGTSVVIGMVYSFAGLWERMDNTSNLAARERIRLTQFSCFVLGTRVVVGGQQNFFGVALGPYLWMRRRDFGRPFLVNEGFPQEVARQVEGQVMARYRLYLSRDRNFLDGVFIPFRVEFSAQPPRVTAMLAQTPIQRKYRRVETLFEKDIVRAASQIE